MLSPTLKSAFWYTGSNLIVKALGFITIPIFTRLLTHDEFGIYNNYLSWLAVLTIVVNLSLEATLISAKRDYPGDLKNYSFSMLVLSQASAILWLALANLFMMLFEELTDLSALYINCIFVYLLFLPAITLLQTWERFVYRYKVTVALSLVMAVGIAFTSVALGIWMTNSLEGVIIGRTMPVIAIGSAVSLWFIVRKSKVKFEYWRYALPIAWPFIPHLLAMTLLGAMNKIFITHMCGADANALYSVAYSCGLIVSLFVSSLNSAFAPWLGDRLSQKQYVRIRKVSVPYAGGFAFAGVLVSLLAPEVLFLMGGESYRAAVLMIPPIVMGCIFQFVYCMYVNVEQFERKTKGMAVASLTAAALNAALDLALIPFAGYMVAAWATAISYAWLMIAHMFLVDRLGLGRVFRGGVLVLIAIIACVLVGSSSFLYPYVIVRWGIFFLGCVASASALWCKRDSVKKLLRK